MVEDESTGNGMVEQGEGQSGRDLVKESHCEIREKLVLAKFTRFHRDDPS